MKKTIVLTIIFSSFTFLSNKQVVAMQQAPTIPAEALVSTNKNNTRANPITKNHKKISRDTQQFFICRTCGNLSKNISEAITHRNLGKCSKEADLASQLEKKGYCTTKKCKYYCLLCEKKRDNTNNLIGKDFTLVKNHIMTKHLLKISEKCLIPEDLTIGKDGDHLLKISIASQTDLGKALREKSNLVEQQPNNSYKCKCDNECKDHQSSLQRIIVHLLLEHRADLLNFMKGYEDVLTKNYYENKNKLPSIKTLFGDSPKFQTSKSKTLVIPKKPVASSFLQEELCILLPNENECTLLPSNPQFNSSFLLSNFNENNNRQKREREEYIEDNQNESETNNLTNGLESKRGKKD